MHSETRVIIITRLRHSVCNVHNIEIVYYSTADRRTSHSHAIYIVKFRTI